MEDKYIKAKERYEKLIIADTKKANFVGHIKVIIFIILATLVVIALVRNFSSAYTILAFISLIIYIALALFHSNIHERIKHNKGLLDINKAYIKRIKNEWQEFVDDGREYCDINHFYAVDLDILGKKSLFQMINTAKTRFGRDEFVNDLTNKRYEKDEIIDRQKAIRELSRVEAFTHTFQYLVSLTPVEFDIDGFLHHVSDKKKMFNNKTTRFLLKWLPVVVILFSVFSFLFGFRELKIISICILFIQTGIWGLTGFLVMRYLNPISDIRRGFNTYKKIFKLIGEQDFESDELIKIKSKIILSDHIADNIHSTHSSHSSHASHSLYSAVSALSDIEKISACIEVRSNAILLFILNTLFLWDIQCAFLLDEWKEKYGDSCRLWLEAVGKLESLVNFSVLENVITGVNYPTISENNKHVFAEGLGHPLIHDASRITNNLNMDNEIYIISGSNMSGKTTFLRTVGINLILAMSGAPVCAHKMTCSLFTVVTSMRISDDLSEGISTFYAELKRIKMIIETAKLDNNIFFMIDEIFKGTNSGDRLYGAKEVISLLDKTIVMGMITTHDLELCDMAKSNRIQNYSFCEYYKDKGIYFDYKIKNGVAKTTNARYLMEMLGITK